MASSNRHWPSIFKSKPFNTSPSQYQRRYDSGCEERTPEPKPRWNPKPEQVRILETVFNSGMVNPPREEIRKIRVQLQEYGQVGDANVFYWFQNRKSRTKLKQRHHRQQPSKPTITAVTAPASSTSTSTNNSNGKQPHFSVDSVLQNSPTDSVNQSFLHQEDQFLSEPFFFPAVENSGKSNSFDSKHGFFSPEMGQNYRKGMGLVSEACHFLPLITPTDHILFQGLEERGPAKSMVSINDVWFEIEGGPFNVREAFGDGVMMIESNGQEVITDEWGFTVHPLQNFGSYYLLIGSKHEHCTAFHLMN